MTTKRGDKLLPGSSAFHKRQARWRHNAFSGSAAMMRANCRSILASNTATDEAKAIAVRIENDAKMLSEALKTRKPGT